MGQVGRTLSTVKLEISNGIAKIILNRPEVLNAMNLEMWQELESLLNELERDHSVRVVVITGAGRAFCAGADISVLKMLLELPLYKARELRRAGYVFELVEKLSKPSIAMVNGYALGGGFELALACDLIIASERASFGLPEIRIGLIPGAGGIQRLLRSVGPKITMQIILTGERISSQEAHRLGIVNKVVPHENLEQETMQIASKLIKLSPLALKLAKQAVFRGLRTDFRTALEYDSDLAGYLYSTRDAREGFSAFLEKREPKFTGE